MLRSIERNIARNRMKDMGVSRINKRMHIRQGDTLPKAAVRKMEKTPQGRDRLLKIRKEAPTLWQRVLYGDIRKDADKAFAAASKKRKMLLHPEAAK